VSGYREPERSITQELDAETWDRMSTILELMGTPDREALVREALRRGLPPLEREADLIAARAVTICPRCSYSPLAPRDVGNTRMQSCFGCGGVWLDNASAAALLESLHPEVREMAMRADANAESPIRATNRPMDCAVCVERMEHRHFTTADVQLDVCVKHGTWFDSSELVRMIDVLMDCKRRRLEFEASVQSGNAEVARQIHALYEAERRRDKSFP
jgi:Zn-finger nucleic acid-binding protein